MTVTDRATGHAVPLTEVDGRLLDPSTLLDAPFSADGLSVTDDATGESAPFTRSDPAPVVVVSDSFDRPDGLIGTADTGQVWIALGNSLHVVGGAAGATGSGQVSVVDSGLSDAIVTFDVPVASGTWTAFARLTDPSNFVGMSGAGAVSQVEAGAFSALGSLDNGAVVAGDTISVTVDGPAVTVSRNGVVEFAGTTTVLAGTRQGFQLVSQSPRIDNFTVTTL